jgi:outer membrane protein assembly factor BamB
MKDVLAAAWILAGLATLFPVTGGAQSRAGWPQWRGPLGNGVSPDGDPPIRWSEGHNVRFKVPIDGDGLASPIVWRERVFVLSALAVDGSSSGEGEPSAADSATSPKPASAVRMERQRFLVSAYNRHHGSLDWQRVANERVPHEGHHRSSAWANASPITDGERIYAHFGSSGTYAYTLDGEPVWNVDLGDMTTRLGYGEGSSPALFGDTLVVNWDHEGDSFVVALDKDTGEELWRRDRPDEPTSWSTPAIYEHEGRVQVVIAAAGRTCAYDIRNGDLIWSLSGLGLNVIPTPIYDSGILYLASGKRDGNMIQVVDLRGARGDLDRSDALIWTRDRDTPYVSTPMLYGGQLYFFKHVRSILTSVDAATGETLFSERLNLGNVYASAVAAAWRIYLSGRDGRAMVLQPGPALEILAENALDDGVDASPAIVGGDLYLRGRRFLYALSRSVGD